MRHAIGLPRPSLVNSPLDLWDLQASPCESHKSNVEFARGGRERTNEEKNNYLSSLLDDRYRSESDHVIMLKYDHYHGT